MYIHFFGLLVKWIWLKMNSLIKFRDSMIIKRYLLNSISFYNKIHLNFNLTFKYFVIHLGNCNLILCFRKGVSHKLVFSTLHFGWENPSLPIDFALGWQMQSQIVIMYNHATFPETPQGCWEGNLWEVRILLSSNYNHAFPRP